MIHELDLYGVLIPPMLAWTGIALAATGLLRLVMGRLGLYRFIWHKPLFDLALLIVALGVVVAATGW
ncbi:MAG: DUF1656 domain-containing protein [Acetobacteraceae bacterium]